MYMPLVEALVAAREEASVHPENADVFEALSALIERVENPPDA